MTTYRADDISPHTCFECGRGPDDCRCGPTSPYLRRPLRTEAEAKAEYLRLTSEASKGGAL